MYLSLYRKWRPKVFDEISGQEHITSILKKQCANNRVSHAYLFAAREERVKPLRRRYSQRL